jgi:hypothetical protein
MLSKTSIVKPGTYDFSIADVSNNVRMTGTTTDLAKAFMHLGTGETIFIKNQVLDNCSGIMIFPKSEHRPSRIGWYG